jgi:recombination protein RecT
VSETSTELTLRQKTEQVVARLTHPEVLAQIEELLPDNVPLSRFVGVAKTAIRTNPDLVTKADPSSLVNAVIMCATDGLVPDGRQAALVLYKGKVGYLRMIGGIRSIAALYGWAIRTNVVYQVDEFDFTEEPPMISHRPERPGVDRGPIVYAYAVATHRDGQRMQMVMAREDIAKRRAKAQTQMVWNEWEGPMSEKTVGHALFKQLPLDPNDVRVARMLTDETGPADAAEQLYGPEAVTGERFNDETGEIIPAGPPNLTGAATEPQDASQQAGTVGSSLAAVPAPGDQDDDETEPGPRDQQAELAEAARAAGTTQAVGAWAGQTIAQVHASGEDGEKWLSYVLRHPGKYDDALYAAVETYVQGLMPGLFVAHTEWLAARAAA